MKTKCCKKIWALVPLLFVTLPTNGANTVETPPKVHFAESANRFTFDLLQLLPANSNFVASGFSIESALAMASMGAKGPTLEEMRQVLHLEGDAAPAMLLTQLQESTKSSVKISQDVWMAAHTGYFPEVEQSLKTNFLAELHRVDFGKDPEAARKTINQKVEEQTAGKIKDILPPSSLTKDSEMVLTNAVYFKGTWLHPFRKDLSHKGDFHSFDGHKINVEFMNQTTRFNYTETEQAQMVELPYDDQRFALIIVLPKGKLSPQALLQDGAKAGLSVTTSKKVDLTLPKFRFESAFELSALLKKLGMGLALTRGKADFGGFRKLGPEEKIWISEVYHKTFIDVNENGTEATAATAVGMMGASAVMVEAPPVKMIVDHPFAFILAHRSSKTILFAGVLGNPPPVQ